MTTAKELALGGMFTALGVVLLCLGRCRPAGAVRLSDFGLGRAAAGTGTLQQTRRVELLRGNRHSGHTSRP